MKMIKESNYTIREEKQTMVPMKAIIISCEWIFNKSGLLIRV
jgi:hypothetical protein